MIYETVNRYLRYIGLDRTYPMKSQATETEEQILQKIEEDHYDRFFVAWLISEHSNIKEIRTEDLEQYLDTMYRYPIDYILENYTIEQFCKDIEELPLIRYNDRIYILI